MNEDVLCVSLECGNNKEFRDYKCHEALNPNCKTGDKNIAICMIMLSSIQTLIIMRPLNLLTPGS